MVDQRGRDGRPSRESDTRETQARAQNWKPASVLPDPLPRDDITYRWVRVSTYGQMDANNVSARLREGWEIVPKEDVPEFRDVITDFGSKFPQGVEVGGLLLCRISSERAKAQEEYYANLARNQLRAQDQNLLRTLDSRMPILKPERSSRVTFGGGGPPKL
jgi:hypothetical protein